MAGTLKKTAWKWCAKYIKLRDAIEDYPRTQNIDFVFCRTCGKLLVRNSQNAQAGHFIGRGSGGHSGVYFDERNINIQCRRCNEYEQSNHTAYRKYMVSKYGEEIIEELEIKHKVGLMNKNLAGYLLYYKSETKRLQSQVKGM